MKPFNFQELDIKQYYFIAHLFDRVLIGEKNEYPHEELLEAIRSDEILEVHFFNETKEIYAARINDQLMVYEPLEHQESPGQGVILRSYLLDKRVQKRCGRFKYDTLEVKEYIKHDEDCLAYVDKTILYRLKRRGE